MKIQEPKKNFSSFFFPKRYWTHEINNLSHATLAVCVCARNANSSEMLNAVDILFRQRLFFSIIELYR
jgi:hypothetical protein